ncbi:MAG: fatty acid hydroxylase family protein [Actinomyces sp.]|nr:MAG: fatty acid hydroxylase family protein [Actinomyces sp.]
MLVVVALDALVLGRRGALARLLALGPSARLDVFTWLLAFVNAGLVLPVVLTAGLAAVGPSWAAARGPDLFGWLSHPALRFVVVVIAIDFLRYWAHRLQHRNRILWRFHAMHHTATEFTVITGRRIHPVEKIVDLTIVTVPLALVGASLPELVAGIVVVRLIDLPQHSMLDWTYGPVGRWLLFSPVGHRIHHSPHRHQWDTNFGDLCPLWDHLFGTWYDGDDVNTEIGLTGSPPAGIAASLLTPFGEAWDDLTGRWRRRPAAPRA